MRKVIGTTGILLFCLTALASASPTNWTFGILASSSDGWVGDRWNVVGVWSTYTDGMNTSAIAYANLPPGHEGASIPSAGGRWGAVRQATNPVGTVDMRSKYSSTIPQSKTWTMNLFYYNVLDTGSPSSLAVTVNASVDRNGAALANADLPYVDGNLSYRYTFAGSFVPGGSVSFDAAHPFTTQTWTITTPHDQTAPDVLTLTVQTVPEPGGLLALGSGLAGLVMIGRYRKR